MNFYLIDILPIALLALFSVGIKPVVPFSSLSDNYLSIKTGRNLRGLFSIVVIFRHLALSKNVGFLFVLFSNLGYLAVSVFFFLSGFGLQKSYIASNNYRERFIRRRIPQVLFPYIVVTAIYWLINAIDGEVYSIKQILLAIINGFPIVSHSWFIISILAFYIVFWILMNLCKRCYLGMIIGACFYQVIYIAFCKKMGYGDWWYNTSHLLIFGMFWATYEKKILKFIEEKYNAFSVIVLFGFLVSILLKRDIIMPIKSISLIFTMLSALLFVLIVLLFTMKFEIGNPVFSYIGRISLEVYLVHGIFVNRLYNNAMYIHNDTLRAVLTVLGSVILGGILNYLLDTFLRRYKKIYKGE